jgi:hypothetical protein
VPCHTSPAWPDWNPYPRAGALTGSLGSGVVLTELTDRLRGAPEPDRWGGTGSQVSLVSHRVGWCCDVAVMLADGQLR